jgi:hypothetical protein
VVAAFAGVTRELAASAEARAAFELQSATARAERRTARTRTRVLTSAARELSQLAAVFEHAAAAQHALAAGAKREAGRSRAVKSADAPTPRPRKEMRDLQQRLMRQQQAQMHEAHAAARRPEVAPSVATTRPAEADRRIDEVAERFHAGARRQPRIRGL